MSEEQLKAFLEKVKADISLQEKLKAAGDNNAVVEIAKAAGFSISADDLTKAQSELSEEELEGVAGGWWHSDCDLCKMFPRLLTNIKALALAGAFYFLNDFHIRLKRHPIPGTTDNKIDMAFTHPTA